ncbi:MAG: exo-alpha-sialidase [Myxococcales bacterium]|nr:exo-alpha-sialidase [Myxococcales bacterium]
MWWSVLACAPPPVELEPPGTEGCGADCVEAPDDPDQRLGFQRLAADASGVWLTFGLADRDHLTNLWVHRLGADGELGPGTEVPTTGTVFAGATERPALALGEGVLGVAFTSVDPYRHGDARSVWLTEGVPDGSRVTFDEPALIDVIEPEDVPEAPEGAQLVVEHASLAYEVNEPWLLWKRQVWGTTDQVVWARQDEGYVVRPVSEELPIAHDCSPPDFRMGPEGPLLAVRVHTGRTLQTAVATGDDFQEVRQISNDPYPYSGEICPEDGPRILVRADGSLVAGWIAPASDAAPRLHLATSDDGGATWTAPWVDADGPTFGQRWLAMTEDLDGRLVVAAEGVDRRTELLTDPAGAGEREPLLVDGASLRNVELATGPDGVVAVGIDPDGQLRTTLP